MTPEEQFDLAEKRRALQSGDAKIMLVQTFTHGLCVQVMIRNKKIGRLIIPNRENGQSLGDVLKMLGDIAEEGR